MSLPKIVIDSNVIASALKSRVGASNRLARKAARQDHVSINQLLTTALAEKLSALMTADYLLERARRGPSRSEFQRLLAKAPRVPPAEADRL